MRLAIDPISGMPTMVPSTPQAPSRGGGGGGGGGLSGLAQVVDALPVDAMAGQLVYDTTDSTLYIYIGGAWTSLGGSSGGSGATGGIIKARQTPAEAPDGVTTTFTFPDAFVPGSLDVFINGLAEAALTETPATGKATFSFAPLAGDVVEGRYQLNNFSVIKARVFPAETPDGFITTFTFPDAWVSGSIDIFINGLADPNFTEHPTSKQVTLTSAPLTGDLVYARYETVGAASTSGGVVSTYGGGTYGSSVYA